MILVTAKTDENGVTGLNKRYNIVLSGLAGM